LAHHSKKIIIIKIPQNKRFYFELYSFFFWPTYIGERRTPFSKAYKSEEVWKKCYGKYWELERNIVRTHWEVGKNEKKSLLPPPTPKHKKKKNKAP